MAKNKRSGKNKRTKLLAAHHTGKLRPHKHTSYGGLALVLLLALTPLLFIGQKAAADQAAQVYAVVAAEVPKTAPVITSPTGGHVYTTADPLVVKGSCPGKTLVKLFKNQVMSGAALCSGGSFSITTDLFVGDNTLIARPYNANDVAGPDSAPVSVSLQPGGLNLSSSSTLSSTQPPAGQLYVTSEVYYRGGEAGSKMDWTLNIVGGQSPYAVSIGWGDGKTDLISRPDAGQFNISHVYARPAGSKGAYTIVIKVSDQAGNTSFLQITAIVSGNSPSPGVLSTVGGGKTGLPGLQLAWQLTGGAVLLVAGFWIGEKRELHIIKTKARAA